jgi:DNA mismatch repair protein MutL
MPITVLPEHVVNQIAAGEVVERPASIVKELTENALDADAAHVEIAVEDGGRKSIRVTDNGRGMDAADLALAFAPHATSKVAAPEDLFAISTLGFRGEALASIAAVSHAHIRSRPADADSGHEVAASADGIGQVRPCAAAPGTTVTVRDLFYNVPARRKFMRTTNTEFAHVGDELGRLALPHPRVSFRLLHNGREVKDLPPADSTLRRVTDLLGFEVAESLLTVRPGGGKAEVSGLIGRPAAARGSSKWQYFFLNGRFVRDRLLSHAVREAYRGLIAPQLWPIAFIFVEVDPAAVDVNVHPTKIEVRFRDAQVVHEAILSALRRTLNRSDLVRGADAAAFGAPPREDDTAADRDRRASLRQALADFFKAAPPRQSPLDFPRERPPGRPPAAAAPPPLPADRARPPAAEAAGAEAPAAEAAGHAPPRPPSPGRAIQVHNTYLVAPTDEGLIIVDQHALHERLLYNDLSRRLTSGPLTAQRMLIPETLQVTPGEANLLQRRAELLERLGIEVSAFGPDAVAVQRFPSLLAERGVAPGAFIREVLDVLGDEETADAERLVENVLSMMACKAAVKAGEPLGAAEIDDLLSRRLEAEKSSACPHGRPTTLELPLRELEKQFERA